jgi:MFS family permease
MNAPQASGKPAAATTAWSPFRHAAFTVLWIATVVSNIGTWMQNAAAGWLMTVLNPDPLIVSLVQVASSLPMFVLALPGGALADIVDRRRLLVIVQIATVFMIAAFSVLVLSGKVSPVSLLIFTFLVGAASALIAPAWQSIVPQLVPRAELQAAVALNSAGFNVSRAVGPALAGLIIATVGLAAPFWLNAVGTLCIIAALIWWRPRESSAHRLPAERFWSAMRIGFRHARYNAHLRATMLRAGGFFVAASAYWALLPLIARDQVAGGPQLYGILLGAIGAAAVAGATALPMLKRRLGADGLLAAGTLGTALALVLFGLARHPAPALAASLLAGMSWIAVLATLNVSAQVALPEWVRGRGLAIFATVMFGGMTLGSALWGQVAGLIGLPAAHFIAAAALAASVPLLRPWKIQTGVADDLSPSMHWPAPVLAHEVRADRGPVLITVEYRIRPEDREPFLAVMAKLESQRRRDGAYDWNVFEDISDEGTFVETFYVDSWLEHLRQHERVTNADRIVQDEAQHFHMTGTPKVTHLIVAEPSAPGGAIGG